jgi:outer membrane protein OmpA-like peptidoglycan-associated protein
MKARLAVPVAALLTAALCAVFLPFMKAAVDGGLKARAQAALAGRGLGAVRVSSDWATLTLTGPRPARAPAVAAVSQMPDAGAVQAIRYDATGQPGAAAGRRAAAASGRAAAGGPAAGSGRPAGSGRATGGSAAGQGGGRAGLTAAALRSRIRGALGRPGVVFASGSAALTGRSDRALRRVAAVLRRDPRARIRIDGFTDSQGSAPGNAALSRARARSARAYLTARGIAAGRLTAEGFGASRPVASNATAAGRQANRRIEFSVRGG